MTWCVEREREREREGGVEKLKNRKLQIRMRSQER